ncbi:hypothetical protein F5B18DRAFT_644547 [Nemania serpens]|nr:hypothetical protein F5B18DRAFT_644547 [Nemania serpens]
MAREGGGYLTIRYYLEARLIPLKPPIKASREIPAVEYIAQEYICCTATWTMRDGSNPDGNITNIHNIFRRHDRQKTLAMRSIFKLFAVCAVADRIVASVEFGKHSPLAAIVCNTYIWDLACDSELSPDAF